MCKLLIGQLKIPCETTSKNGSAGIEVKGENPSEPRQAPINASTITLITLRFLILLRGFSRRLSGLLVLVSFTITPAMRMTRTITTPGATSEESFKETHDHLTGTPRTSQQSTERMRPLKLSNSSPSPSATQQKCHSQQDRLDSKYQPRLRQLSHSLISSPLRHISSTRSAGASFRLLPERRNSPCVLLPCTLLQRGPNPKGIPPLPRPPLVYDHCIPKK